MPQFQRDVYVHSRCPVSARRASMKKAIVFILFSYVCSCTHASEPRIALAWDPSPGESVIGYNVYRSETSGCCHKKINTEPVRQPQYTDTSVKAGKTYYYRVTAVNSKGEESSFSEEITAVPKE
jgi:fibronectin type 3 domain-containing protein